MAEDLKRLKFTLPYNKLAEELVLGSMCLDKANIPLVLQKLPLDTFYTPRNKLLYKSLIDLYENHNDLTLTSIISYLEEKEILETIGGVEFLVRLINNVVTTVNLDKYILLLQEKYFRRLLIILGKFIIESSYDQKRDLKELLADIESRIYTITEKRFVNTISDTSELLSSVLLDIQGKFQSAKKTSGLLTSYHNLDALTQGLQNSELIIIAGRPSMGKTAFSLNIAKNIVENYDLSVLIFSLEMSKQQLVYRFISIWTGINLIKLRNGNLTINEWDLFKQAIQNLTSKAIYIDDNSNISLSEIQVKSRQILRNKNHLGLIIIDYLQLMQLANQNNNRAQELSYITRTLKILSKELNIPIIVLSQLSRNVESRIDKRPILSDLRDSGCFLPKKTYFNQEVFQKELASKLNILQESFLTGQKPVYFPVSQRFFQDFQYSSQHKFFTCEGWVKIQNLSFQARIPLFSSLSLKPLFWIYKKNLQHKGFNLVYDIKILVNPIYILNYQIFHNSIEQDADIVLMLYRDDYYNSDKVTNITEIILAKHRNGPVGLVELIFDRNSLQFKNLKKEATIS